MANLKSIAATLAILGSGSLVLAGCEKDKPSTEAPGGAGGAEGEGACAGDKAGEGACAGEGSCSADKAAEGEGDAAEGEGEGEAAEGEEAAPE